MSTNPTFQSVDEYIASYPETTSEILQKIYNLVKKIAPASQESMSYGIPTFKIGKNAFHFGGYEKHIGIYPTPPVVAAFADKLTGYSTAKGSIQLPLSEPMPYDLIEQLAKAALIDKV